MMKHLVLCATTIVLLSACGSAPTAEAISEAPSLNDQMLGLWQVNDIKNITKDEDQPHAREYHMYTATHELIILAGADRPKLTKSISDMTAEEVMSQQPVGAGLYKYTVDGNAVSRTNVVALSAFYEGRTTAGEIEVDGDTLVYRDAHSADGDLRQWTMTWVE